MQANATDVLGWGCAVRVFFLILLALVLALLSAIVVELMPAELMPTGKSEFTFAAPDPDPRYVKMPRQGQSYACEPLANANAIDNRLAHKATVWANQKASNVAIRMSEDGKRLLLMRAMYVSVGVTDPEEFKVTLNNNSYMMAEEQITLGVALIIFDVRTMKMVCTFNGQGMLGMKGETVLFQCH
jgi:hypothetical protein